MPQRGLLCRNPISLCICSLRACVYVHGPATGQRPLPSAVVYGWPINPRTLPASPRACVVPDSVVSTPLCKPARPAFLFPGMGINPVGHLQPPTGRNYWRTARHALMPQLCCFLRRLTSVPALHAVSRHGPLWFSAFRPSHPIKPSSYLAFVTSSAAGRGGGRAIYNGNDFAQYMRLRCCGPRAPLAVRIHCPLPR